MDTDGTATPAPEGGAGQGAEESSGGLFDSYLQAVPEDARETVTGYLKDAEKHLNTRLRDAADLSARYGPYKDIDLTQVPPQQLAQVIDWYKTVASSPDSYQEWLKEQAKEAGFFQEQETAPTGEPDDIEQLIAQQVQQALKPFQDEQLSSKEQFERERMARHIETTLGKIESEHGKLSDEAKEAILALGEQHQGEDWVEHGFAKYQSISGNAQAQLVNDKANQHSTPLGTGGQAAPTPPRNFQEAQEQALERLLHQSQ